MMLCYHPNHTAVGLHGRGGGGNGMGGGAHLVAVGGGGGDGMGGGARLVAVAAPRTFFDRNSESFSSAARKRRPRSGPMAIRNCILRRSSSLRHAPFFCHAASPTSRATQDPLRSKR